MNEMYSSQGSSGATREIRETGLIGILIVLAKHKRLVLGLPFVASLLAVVISLALPNVYRATTKIMPPQEPQSGAGALLAQLGGSAAAAMSVAGLKSPNDMYIGMLKSRTVADHLIRQFDLKTEYATDSQENARRILEGNTSVVSGKDGLIAIEVEDEDKKKAPLIANAYAAELARLTQVLAVTEAAKRRLFFEQQLEQAKDSLAAIEVKLKSTLDTNGVVSVDSESKAIVETIGQLRGRVSAKEIELNSMKAFVTDNNPDYKRTNEELSSLRAELARLQDGTSTGLSDRSAGMKSGGLESVKLLRDVKYHQMLYEMLAKQYEAARLDEAKDASVVQVLDPAVEPERKAKPSRALIVLGTAALSLFVSVALAFLRETRQRAMAVPEVVAQWTEFRRQLRWK